MTEDQASLPTLSNNGSGGFRSSLELLYEIGREVSGDLDLRTLLHRVLFLAMKNIGAISGSIIVLDENGQPSDSALLVLGETHTHTMLQLHMTYDQGLAGWVARHLTPALVPDTLQDDRWLQLSDEAQEVQVDPPGKSAVSAPILAREKLVGVITLVHPQSGFFMPDHLALIEAIAGWAGTAISHAQLFDHLQTANRRYRELFEDSIEPILITDWGGVILEINRQAQRTTEICDADLTGMNIADLKVVDPQNVGANFEKLRGGELVSYEAELRTYEGRDIPVQVYAREINTRADETHVQWILRDLSERKDLDRLREDLTAMIYHDLRSPLSNIISSLEMLAAMSAGASNGAISGEVEDDGFQSMLDIARRSTDRIQRLTSSLLDIHRFESGHSIGSRQWIDLHELISDALNVVHPALVGRADSIELDVETDLPPVFVDADMVRRVLINLLENAIKFSPENSVIRVDARSNGSAALTRVIDYGVGISAASQERIFEKFNQIGIREGPKGLGLGLAYCRLAVAAHGGKIWVESEPGRGATFSFTLPFDAGPSQPPHPGA